MEEAIRAHAKEDRLKQTRLIGEESEDETVEDGDDAKKQPDFNSQQEERSPETESQKSNERISASNAEKTEKEKDEDFEKFMEEFGDEFDEEDENDENILPNIKEYQSKQDDYTCLMPRDLSSKVVTNSGKSYIEKETSDGKTNISIAPGEGRVPSNILKELFFDVKAWPKHHPSGKFGIHHERKKKVTYKMYFNQRFLNQDERS